MEAGQTKGRGGGAALVATLAAGSGAADAAGVGGAAGG